MVEPCRGKHPTLFSAAKGASKFEQAGDKRCFRYLNLEVLKVSTPKKKQKKISSGII